MGNEDIVVTQLGFYDRDADGLVDAHDVGIYDTATEAVVVSAEVPAGVAAPELDGFRYVDVVATTLHAGETYVVLGHRPTDGDAILWFASYVINPFVTYDSEVAVNDTAGLVYTNTPFGLPGGWFGPSFVATFE